MGMKQRGFAALSRFAPSVFGILRAGRALGLLLALGVGGLAACTQVVLPPPPVAGAPWPLGPGDRLRIIVFEQNQLGGEFAVDEDGAVSLPLIGRVRVAGLVSGQAEQLIAARLGGG